MKFIPTLQKITLFQSAAQYLTQHPYQYQWNNSSACNCGTLVKLLQPDAFIDQQYRRILFGMYSNEVYDKFNYCSTTGLPVNLILQVLFNAGFTKEEIVDIEFLGQLTKEEVGKYIPSIEYTYGQVDVAINYFQSKALEMQLQLNQPSSQSVSLQLT